VPGHPVAIEVNAVVGVQVAQQDGVDVGDPGVPLQQAKGAVAHVHDETEPVRLEQVTG
jgi:hypothetical protein